MIAPDFSAIFGDRIRPEPPAAFKTGTVDLPDACRLSYWDTGGAERVPVVFAHPLTGSAESFVFQQSFFAAAGYRTIAYSRRGHGMSSMGPKGSTATQASDLADLLDLLNARDPVYLVGVAAGGATVLDFAISNPGRVAGMTIANSLMAVTDPKWRELLKAAHGDWLKGLPPEAKELCGDFRVACREDAAAWAAAARTIQVGRAGMEPQTLSKPITFAEIATLRMPILLITGTADLYLPPVLLEVAAAQIPGADSIVIDHTGHAPHFERPDVFNPIVLDHVERAAGVPG